MQAIKKQKNKKPFIITLGLILIAAAAVGAYLWFARPVGKKSDEPTTRPVNTVDYSPATPQEKQESDNAKQKIVEQQQNTQQPANITLTIVRAGQLSGGQPLNIRTTVDGATSGSCAATLTNNGQTVKGTGTLVFDATSYSCSIDIPASSFPANGQWQLSITATNGKVTSQAATQSVTITK